MAAIENLIINAVRTALITGGYTVFDSILDHHTGRRTKSKTYIELDRSITMDLTEITQECSSGPYTLNMRYRQGQTLIKNTNGEMLTFTDNVNLILQSISQVETAGMYNRINIAEATTETGSIRSLMRDFVISGTLSVNQDRT